MSIPLDGCALEEKITGIPAPLPPTPAAAGPTAAGHSAARRGERPRAAPPRQGNPTPGDPNLSNCLKYRRQHQGQFLIDTPFLLGHGITPSTIAAWEARNPRTRHRRTQIDPALRQRAHHLACRHPAYGHRKIWALLGEDRRRVSPSTIYRWLKAAGLLLAPGYQAEARRRGREARARYLKRPKRPNELWQIDITLTAVLIPTCSIAAS